MNKKELIDSVITLCSESKQEKLKRNLFRDPLKEYMRARKEGWADKWCESKPPSPAYDRFKEFIESLTDEERIYINDALSVGREISEDINLGVYDKSKKDEYLKIKDLINNEDISTTSLLVALNANHNSVKYLKNYRGIIL